MKIAIDISSVIYGTGVSVYTKNLVENLLKLDKANQYIIFGGSLRRSRELKNFVSNLDGKNHKSRIFPLPPTFADFIWNKAHVLPVEMLTGKVDILHSSDWAEPPSKAFKVTTIHDLTPILYPEWSHSKIVSTHKMRLKWVLKETDRIIVPSETTAKDLQKLGFNKSKIRIIPEAVDISFKKTNENVVSKVKLKYGIKANYLLSVGVNQRKNTERIIEAFEKIQRDSIQSLVIVGHPYKDYKTGEHIIYTGHVTEEDMPALYSGSEALVYPSLYEGFGLPILEAFACQTPVVTSNIGSMSDLARDAGVLVDPVNIDSIVRGIRESLNNREKYASLGLRKLKEYSWEKTAKSTFGVYAEAT